MDIWQQLNQVAQERDLPLDELVRELEAALAAAYKKFVNAMGDVTVRLDPRKGWSAAIEKEVVGEAIEPSIQISLVEARKRRPDAEIGDFIEIEVDPNRFGRIAAQTFKQVLSQKLREAEHRRIKDTFSEKLGQVVSGTVTRREEARVFVQVNRVEAVMPHKEQVPTEHYRPNDRIKVYVLAVDELDRRGAKVVVSRTIPNLVRKLFEIEVPEIAEGIVQIVKIAREAGQRTKIAVTSTDERVDAVGACVGPRGARVQAICDELHDEKIDVVPFSENIEEFIKNALSPAKVNSIKRKPDDPARESTEPVYVVSVNENQLSLAIGKGGQNVRLAAKLTGCGIDIVSDSSGDGGRQRTP